MRYEQIRAQGLADPHDACATQIEAKIAIFSKLIVAHAPRETVGVPFGFTHKPEEFDAQFKRAATPSDATITNTGLTTLDDAWRSGAWTVRRLGRFVFLARQSRDGRRDAQYDEVRQPEFQTSYVSQVTFRFTFEDWAAHGPVLAENAEQWLETVDLRDPNLSTEWTCNVTTEAPVEDTKTPFLDIAAVDMGAGAPSTILPSCVIPYSGNRIAMADVLRALTPDQRETASVALGFKLRFSGISLQVFASDRLRYSDTGHVEEEIAALAARHRFAAAPALEDEWCIPLCERILDADLVPLNTEVEHARLMQLLGAIYEHGPVYLDGFERGDVLRCARTLDYALDHIGSRKGDTKQTETAYRALISSVLLDDPLECHWLFEALSTMEFGPALIASCLTDGDDRVQRNLLAAMVELHAVDQPTFKNLTARMVLPDQKDLAIWDVLVKTPYAHAAFESTQQYAGQSLQARRS